MENRDLSKISLKDTGFLLENASYTNWLKEHNITNVEQLLDEKLRELRSKNYIGRADEHTFKALIGLIGLVKFKYLNIPLGNEDFLNYKIVRFVEGLPYYESHIDLEDETGDVFSRPLEDIIYGMPYAGEIYMAIWELSDAYEMLNESSLRVVDVLKIIMGSNSVKYISGIDETFEVVLNIINTIIEAYKKKHGALNFEVNPKVIESYDNKIAKLVKEKHAIDEAIISLVRERDKIKTL